MSRPNGATDYFSSTPGTFHNLKFPLVFSTKHRKPWLTDSIRPRVLGGIIRGERDKPLEIGGVADHVHILFGWRADESIATLVRNLKANSSKWIHENFPELREFRCQEGYAIFSVSQSQVARVTKNIQTQEEHHRRRTFQEELREFLQTHEVEYDERYLLD